MRGSDQWGRVLNLEEPWFVERVAIDPPSRRVDMVLGLHFVKKSFFDNTRCCPQCGTAFPAEIKTQVLRHMSFGEMRTYLEVPANIASRTAATCPCARTWASPGSRFTIAMERHIENALRLLKSLEAVTVLTGLTLEETREFNGRRSLLAKDLRTQPGAQATSTHSGIEVSYLDGAEEAAAPAAVAAPAKAATADGPPPESHPVWLRLASGQTRVRTHDIALLFLLEQVKLSLTTNPSAATQGAAVRMVRQYFVKYWSRYGAAFTRFVGSGTGASAAAPVRSAAPDVPPETDQCWQRLIDGSVVLGGDSLGLNLLLERLRLYLGGQPTPEERLAAARSLRQFFLKYGSRLRSALATLKGVDDGGLATRPAGRLPPETDGCWQRWLRGDLEINTDHVGLIFLLERLRQAIAADPSAAAVGFATRTLRQFFSKYEGRLGREIQQLAGVPAPVTSTGAQNRRNVVEFIEIPAEDDPSWRQLISGQKELTTNSLGLNFLLEQVRLSLGTQPSDATIQAGARILRQYFIKNRARHRSELEQLKVASN